MYRVTWHRGSCYIKRSLVCLGACCVSQSREAVPEAHIAHKQNEVLNQFVRLTPYDRELTSVRMLVLHGILRCMTLLALYLLHYLWEASQATQVTTCMETHRVSSVKKE